MNKLGNTKTCPLCQLENNCGIHEQHKAKVCWCALQEFPKEIFELVPEEKMRKACICASCLEKFKALTSTT